jgi:hypothetical protein
MNNESRQPHNPPEIAAGTGVTDAWQATDEFQAWCVRTFRPDVDLDELEVSQQQYREVRAMLDETLPFDEWLKWRPRYVKPNQYGQWIEALESTARELEAEFGVALLMAPPMSTQRERPH